MTTLILRSEFLWKYSRAKEPELSILPGAAARAQNKNQKEPELSLQNRTGAGAIAILEVGPAPGPFLDTNGFAK